MSTLLSLLLLLAAAGAADAPGDAFHAIDEPYQAIRLALLQDSTRDVSENAKHIAEAARALKRSPSAERAAVAADSLDEVEALLPELIERADALAAADSIGPQREALKKLSQPLIRWHELVQGPKPRVAYCSMERGAWLQPDGVLGNPYGGTRMPRCGRFVSN
jgi:hypothetical protein